MALLILRGAVVAGAGVGGGVDFGEVEGEVGGDVGVGGVDAAVENGDADAFALGDVPGAVRGAAGDVVAVAADLLDGPALVVGCRRRCRRWSWGWTASADGDAEGVWGEPEVEVLGGDDAVMEDVLDVGLGGERRRVAASSGGAGLDGGDAEVLVALDEAGTDGTSGASASPGMVALR